MYQRKAKHDRNAPPTSNSKFKHIRRYYPSKIWTIGIKIAMRNKYSSKEPDAPTDTAWMRADSIVYWPVRTLIKKVIQNSNLHTPCHELDLSKG